jgi:C1A family cysteine protease
MITKKLDRKKDERDMRDKIYGLTRSAIALPATVDLFPQVPIILDQGDMGSCTAHGCAGLFNFIQQKDITSHITDAPERLGDKFDNVSEMFIYTCERNLEGTFPKDNGAQVRSGIKSLNKFGVCKWETWPYSQHTLTSQPNALAIHEAADHKISVYSRLTSLGDMKHCLAEGYPFAFGTWLFDSFMHVDKSGMVKDPIKGELFQGGHCMYCVGYDDLTKLFTVVNSWGPDWGNAGRCFMSYNYLANPNLTSDIWTIRK